MGILGERKQIDSVTLMRRAARECHPVDADFCVLKEYPLNQLEKALIQCL